MNEPALVPKSAVWFPRLGYGLLIVGFLWLCASDFLRGHTVVAVTSRFTAERAPEPAVASRSAAPRQEIGPLTLTYDEIQVVLWDLSGEIQRALPLALPPALLMLGGALMLAFSPRGQR